MSCAKRVIVFFNLERRFGLDEDMSCMYPTGHSMNMCCSLAMGKKRLVFGVMGERHGIFLFGIVFVLLCLCCF